MHRGAITESKALLPQQKLLCFSEGPGSMRVLSVTPAEQQTAQDRLVGPGNHHQASLLARLQAPTGNPGDCLLWACFLGVLLQRAVIVAPGPGAPGPTSASPAVCTPGLWPLAPVRASCSQLTQEALPALGSLMFQQQAKAEEPDGGDKHKSPSWLGILRSAGSFSPPYLPPGLA